MSFAARHNKGSFFNCDTEGFEYYSLKDLYDTHGRDQEYIIQGIYINRKSEYGPAPVAICDEYFVNLPQHMTEEVEEIMRTPEDVEAIKAGKVAFIIETYTKTIGKKEKLCHGIRWIDVD